MTFLRVFRKNQFRPRRRFDWFEEQNPLKLWRMAYDRALISVDTGGNT
jgi:hypothetical protein